MANTEDERPDFSEADFAAEDAAAIDPLAEGAAVEGNDIELPLLVADDSKPGEDAPEDKKDGILGALATAGPYSAMLGVSALAIFIAITFLGCEMASYKFDMTKKSIDAVLSSPSQSGPAESAPAEPPPAE